MPRYSEEVRMIQAAPERPTAGRIRVVKSLQLGRGSLARQKLLKKCGNERLIGIGQRTQAFCVRGELGTSKEGCEGLFLRCPALELIRPVGKARWIGRPAQVISIPAVDQPQACFQGGCSIPATAANRPADSMTPSQ